MTPLPRISSAHWRDILEHLLSVGVGDTVQSIRVTTFSCYAHLGGDVVNEFEPMEICALVRGMLTHITDETATVRSSICKVLGSWIYYPYVTENNQHVFDIVAALSTIICNEETLHVRVRGAWALANLCDALRVSEFKNIADVDGIMSSLLHSAMVGTNDSYKVKSNVVRALGNLGNAATASWLLQYYNGNTTSPLTGCSSSPSTNFSWGRPGSASSIDGVVRFLPQRNGFGVSIPDATANGGTAAPSTTPFTRLHCILTELIATVGDPNVKVRWNGCYGIGKTISNPNLVTTAGSIAPLTAIAIQALCSAIQSDQNFKVRIQASQALSTPTAKILYGNSLPIVWTSVINALQVVHLVDDFEQFKYSQQLKEQLLLTLRHLIRISGPIAADYSLHIPLHDNAAYIMDLLDAMELTWNSIAAGSHDPMAATSTGTHHHVADTSSPLQLTTTTTTPLVLPSPHHQVIPSLSSSTNGSPSLTPPLFAPQVDAWSCCASSVVNHMEHDEMIETELLPLHHSHQLNHPSHHALAVGGVGGVVNEEPDAALLLRTEFDDLRLFLSMKSETTS
jgi:hypothetical protein